MINRRCLRFSPEQGPGRERGLAAGYTPAFGTAARDLAKALAGLAGPPLNMIGAFVITAHRGSVLAGRRQRIDGLG